jgi:hypothetical protein
MRPPSPRDPTASFTQTGGNGFLPYVMMLIAIMPLPAPPKHEIKLFLFGIWVLSHMSNITAIMVLMKDEV